jgi:hypothetical protein
MPTERRAGLMDNQRTELQPTHDAMLAWKSAVGLYQCLPGLRGFWPGSATTPSIPPYYVNDLGGDYYRSMEYVGTYGQKFSYWLPFIPTVSVVGSNAVTTGYCSCGDRPSYKITGTEPYFDQNRRGLTFGAWWKWVSPLTGAHGLMGKDDGSGLRFSYYLEKTATHTVRCVVTQDGVNRIGCESTDTITYDDWHLIIGRYIPAAVFGGEVSVFLDGVKSAITTSVPSSLYNSTASLRVGFNTQTATDVATRYWSMAFISSMHLTDGICSAIWHHTRAMFAR